MVLMLGKLSSPTTTIRSERRNHSRSPTSPPQLEVMKTISMLSMMMKIKIQVNKSSLCGDLMITQQKPLPSK